MKNREIKQKIIQDMKDETPDILSRIDLQSIEIIEPKEPFYKRLFKPALVPSFIIAILVLIPLIMLNLGQNPSTTPGTDMTVYTEREQTYTLSALSAISLLNQVDDEPAMTNTASLMFLSHSFADSGPELLLDNYLPQLNRNLAMIEPLIGDKESIQFETVTSELEDYDYKVIFSNTNIRNQTIEYIMHYNEIQEDVNTYLIDGIMIIDNITYTLTGESTIDGDEFDLEIIAYLASEEDTYVEILQEVSQTEHTLEYEVVRNDETLYESALSFEIEGDEVTIEINYESETLTYTFDIERETINNEFVYFIEYEIESLSNEEAGEIIVEIIYDEADNTFYYHYIIESDDVEATRYIKRLSLVN